MPGGIGSLLYDDADTVVPVQYIKFGPDGGKPIELPDTPVGLSTMPPYWGEPLSYAPNKLGLLAFT